MSRTAPMAIRRPMKTPDKLPAAAKKSDSARNPLATSARVPPSARRMPISKRRRTTDIEIVKGLSDGEQIITGSYKVIRTIRNEAKVKVDNRAPSVADTKS